jgi:hypothetical protein
MKRGRGMTQDADMVTTIASTARSAAAERMRRHRERQRQGLRCLMIEISETQIEALIRQGLLPATLRNESFQPRTREEVLQKMRAGPAGRKMLEKFLAKFDKLERGPRSANFVEEEG